MTQYEEVIRENMEEATNIFPETGEWSSYCFQRADELEEVNLPCHLHDDAWLSRYIVKTNEGPMLDTKAVLEYLKSSNSFNQRRHDYELTIVKWQIEWNLKGKARWVHDGKIDYDSLLDMEDCDLVFRQGVIDTLVAIGLSKDVVEEGLERFAYIWQEPVMLAAYRNQTMALRENCDDSIEDAVLGIDDEYLESWLKLRKYDYYHDHINAVQTYGVDVGSDLTEEEAKILREYLDFRLRVIKRRSKRYSHKVVQKLLVHPEVKDVLGTV